MYQLVRARLDLPLYIIRKGVLFFILGERRSRGNILSNSYVLRPNVKVLWAHPAKEGSRSHPPICTVSDALPNSFFEFDEFDDT